MPVIAVINRKGGSGKSTLATHLAAYCATRGLSVMLGDVDRQQSTQTWLKLRAEHLPHDRAPIVGWSVDPRNVLRPPAGTTHVILDTPGGLHGLELARVAMFADAILMPVCHSIFDRASAADCYAELRALPRVARGQCRVAAIGMRLDARTKAAKVLKQWAESCELPFLGVLRESQAYVRSVEEGMTLFDLPEHKAKSDLLQWQPILEWLAPVLNGTPATDANSPDPVRTRASARPIDHLNGIRPDPSPRPAAPQLPARPLATLEAPSTLLQRVGRLLPAWGSRRDARGF